MADRPSFHQKTPDPRNRDRPSSWFALGLVAFAFLPSAEVLAAALVWLALMLAGLAWFAAGGAELAKAVGGGMPTSRRDGHGAYVGIDVSL